MFKSLISELLNRVLGTYIENLDPSKLNVSIWGGDVELTGLEIKQSALDELNLPVRPVFGYIGKLTLKIPWKDLYNASWVARVEEVTVVAVPNTSVTYNQEREDNMHQDAKMAALLGAEEARKKHQGDMGDQSKPKDGFVEKLMAQVIRNIQIYIRDIHIRYEDSVSCPTSHFAAGVTLHNLSIISTDKDWTPCLDKSQLVYKLSNLDSLGVYWLPDAPLLTRSSHTKKEMLTCLIQQIASKQHTPQGMKYMIGPISATAKLQMNTKPEEPDPEGHIFASPALSLNLVMEKLAIGLSRHQYSNIMALLDSLDRLKISSKFRKYRPASRDVKKHTREWWWYAYECKLENIRRVHENWSWEHISRHRANCRRYKAAYKARLENRKLTTAQQNDLNECERVLDVFNLTLVRRQAEMEVKREGLLRQEEKQNRGWFSGWFSSSPTKEAGDKSKEGNIVKKFEAEMTDDEKRKMYEAIGYSESGPPPDLPLEYVDMHLVFLLHHLVLTITDEDASKCVGEGDGQEYVTQATLDHVSADIQKRSGGDAIKVCARVQSFQVDGYSGPDPSVPTPRLVKSEGTTSSEPLLDVMLETQPLDKTCDQRIVVDARPLQVFYNADTIHRITAVFHPPEDISLQQLQAAALNQLEVVKERSAAGLQAAIDNHSVLDLNVAFAASHIIIPEHGIYTKGGSAVIVTLGSIVMRSVPRDKTAAAAALGSSRSHEETVEFIRTASYDHFTIELVDIQALVSLAGEDWCGHLCGSGEAVTPLHLLRPTTLHLDLFKCLLTDDPTLVRLKINISLPSVALTVADERLLQLAYIAHSIPQASSTPTTASASTLHQLGENDGPGVGTADAALYRLEHAQLCSPATQESPQATPQFTNLVLDFTIHEVSVDLHRACGEGVYRPLLHVAALAPSITLTQRTFDLNASIILGGVLVQYLDGEDDEYRLLSTPLADGSDQALLTLHFTQVNPKSPDFEEKHKSTAQLLHVQVNNLRAQLEQSAILSILAFIEQLNAKLAQLVPEQQLAIEDSPREPGSSVTHTQIVSSSEKKSKSETREVLKTKALGTAPHKKQSTIDITTLRVVAELGQVSVIIGLHNRKVAQVDVAGLVVNMTMKGKDITIKSRLQDFTIIDPTPAALHPKIVEVVEAEAWEAEVAVYGAATEDQYLNMQHVDTSVLLTFGCARIVFLNKFVSDVLNWVDKFQSAKAAVASVSVAAAAAAQASLQEAYEKCSRISLALTLRAPLILIPQDSGSLSGLMVDLGQITINNKFEMGQERNELGFPAIYDLINLNLHNVKLSRVELSGTGSLAQEYDLLQPISLNISICRNLTIAWHKQRPEVEVAAKLRPIKMCLSEEDLLVALTVLQDNLGEQSDHPSPSTHPDHDLIAESSRRHRKGYAEREREVERELAAHGLVFTKVHFSFTIEAVTLSLLTGGTHNMVLPSASSETNTLVGDSKTCLSPTSASTTSASSGLATVLLSHSAQPIISSMAQGISHPDSSTPRDKTSPGTSELESSPCDTSSVNIPTPVFTLSPTKCLGVQQGVSGTRMEERKALAEVSLDLVTLKGELKSDATLVANLVLFDFILQDTRPGHEHHITRMLERTAQSGKKGMLDITYTQAPSTDKFVDLRISSFVMVLHLPFLMRLQKFFIDNLPHQPETSQPTAATNAVAKTKDVAKYKQCQGSEDDGIGVGGLLTVRVKVEQPDIILVEDLSTQETSCIIFHAEASSDIKVAPQHQHITACVTNIQMYTCIFNPKKRHRTLSQILERCEATLFYSVTPTHAEHVELKLSQMNLRVSIGTIELLSSITAALSSGEGNQGHDGGGSREGEDAAQDWTELWQPRTLDPAEFSFLAVEEAEEALFEEGSIIEQRRGSSREGPGGEMALVVVECVLVTLEAGSHTSPIPLIKFQAALNASVTGFKSQKMNVDGTVSVEVAYFNPRLAVWEPLLEPVEPSHPTSPTSDQHTPWTLNFQLSQDMSSGEDSRRQSMVATPTASPDTDEVDFEAYPTLEPVTVLSLTAKDALEVTVTRTFIDVASTLSQAFSEAYQRRVTAARGPCAPYRVINRSGLHVSVAVWLSGFQVAGEGREEVQEVMVESGAEVGLFEVRVATPKHRRVASLVAECQTAHDRTIVLKIPSLECSVVIPVGRADKRYFEVENKVAGEKWGLVASITVESGCKVVTLSSCVQVSNHLDVPVDVYYMTPQGNEVESVVTLASNQSALLPLHAIYTPTAELFFCVEGHNVCIMPLIWRGLQNNPGRVQELHCPPRDIQEVHGTPFIIAATGEVEQILWGGTSRRTMTSCLYRIHLRPRLLLHNLLPVPISLEPPGTMASHVLLPGASLHLTKAQPGAMYLQLQLLDYLSRDWICGKPVESDPPELSVWTFESRGDVIGGPLYLDLGMLTSHSPSTLALSLYCPFWMVNKTDLMLTYRGDTPNNIVVHEEGNTEAILFSFKSKAFFGKKKAAVKVEDSDWSEKFSLDVVGNSGSVLCKGPDRSYQVGVDIQLGNSGLTKLVIFSPFYRILNKAPYDLEVAEVGVPQADWFTILSGECIGWWPMTSERSVHLRVRGTLDKTPPLPYDRPLTTLLPLANKYGGVRGEVSMTEGGTVVSLDQCCPSTVSALLINHLSSTTISLWQHGTNNGKLALKPQTVVPYTWGDPMGTLSLVWAAGEGKTTAHSLDRDDQGLLDKSEVRWVVFFSNNQRCLLFTDSPSVALAAVNAVEFERFQQDITLSLNSIGLSLIDDSSRREVAYISVASSGVVWEHRKMKGKKQRPFTQSQTELLEKCYQLYQAQMKVTSDPGAVQSHFIINRNLEVNYAVMTVTRPFTRIVRRTFQPGVWLQVKFSAHQRQIHLKVNSVQVDNQMCDVMFPVVLARVPSPRSVMAETVAKPFCEVSVVQRVTSPMFIQFRYLAMLVQEFHVKVELPFIFSIMEVLTPTSASPQDPAAASLYSDEKYEGDMKVVRGDLSSTVAQQVEGGHRDYYQNLHLSPIKMHLSFSLTRTDSGSSEPVGGQVIHLFLQSVGVTLSEVQDVVFRLAYLERLNQWLSKGQLLQEVVAHYRGQVVKQLYVLVLGLDVIGNPFGLVVGLTKGVEDLFYEPFQGAIEGPGEFAEGMLYGVGSFLGKTLGGAAGAVSRITGTIGKGVAALTLDEDYQKRRREAMHRKPADGIESLARGGKGIVTGVFDGVTGIFTKPIHGAREEGVEGFFKGMGKGVVGLVTRPASGVIDFASGSFDAVMRVADTTEEVTRRRPARFIASDSVIRPYVEHWAQGAKLLRELEKGRYAKTDTYVAHVYIIGSRAVLLATNKRVMQVTRNDMLGHLKIDWVHSYEEISEPPTLTPKGLRLSIKQEKKRVLGMFGGGDNSKVLPITSEEQAKVSSQSQQGMSVNRMLDKEYDSTRHQHHPHPPSATSQHPSNPQPTRQQPTQASSRRGLFGVIGTIGVGFAKLSKEVSQSITKQGSGTDPVAGRQSSSTVVNRQHPHSSQQHINIVEGSIVILVEPKDPIFQWFLSEVSKVYLK